MRLKPKRIAAYVRVSTAEQSTKAQESDLKEYVEHRGWVLQGLYSDMISGAKDSRPALQELMAACRQRKVDVVLVWKFDRFARSVRHLVTALDEFKRLGIDFVSLTEQLDTSAPSGELVFHIFGAIAQFERALISERTKAGLIHARRNGTKLGRPPIKSLNTGLTKRIAAEWRRGELSMRKLATKYGTSLWAIQQATKTASTSI